MSLALKLRRVGKCNNKRCCCIYDPPSKLRGEDGRCIFLSENGCVILNDMLKGLTEEQLKRKYGPVHFRLFRLCVYKEKSFPSPYHFGLIDETENRKLADDKEHHYRRVIKRFNEWKKKVGCSFSFELVED